MSSDIANPTFQRRAIPQDVRDSYELFLGRSLENEDVIVSHLSGDPDLWTFIRTVVHCEEAERRRMEMASGHIHARQDGRDIEVIADAPTTARLTAHIAEVWSRYGREDAYFSVLTNPKYLKDNLQLEDIEEFYGTGEQEVEGFERVLARNDLAISPDWSMMELGCGVGRMAEPFARRLKTYLGVDISGDHLTLARARLDDRGISNAELMLLPACLGTPPSFDLFYSVIVLQHNPPPIIHQLLDFAFASLNSGGIAWFQVPCHRHDYSFRIDDYLAGDGRHEHMEMHAIPQRHIFALFAKHGLTPIEVAPNDRIGPLGISYGFLAQKA